MQKTGDFHSNLLESWELVTEGYQGRHEISHISLEMHDRNTLIRYGNLWYRILKITTRKHLKIIVALASTFQSLLPVTKLKLQDKIYVKWVCNT